MGPVPSQRCSGDGVTVKDVQLSRNFWLSEPPCWELATPTDVARLQETAARVAQPIRNEFGPTRITSWKWWSSGCVPRDKTHAHGGTIDLVTLEADLTEVFEWGSTYLLPTGYIGRWILEPEIRDAAGKVIQGAHIHMAPRAAMLAHNGDGTIKALVELEDGSNYVYAQLDEGSYLNPYVLDPLEISARPGIGRLLLILGGPLLVGLALRKAQAMGYLETGGPGVALL